MKLERGDEEEGRREGMKRRKRLRGGGSQGNKVTFSLRSQHGSDTAPRDSPSGVPSPSRYQASSSLSDLKGGTGSFGEPVSGEHNVS